ncbi:PREDICTED: EP300-interacting inhibitor of differentiation 3 [Elephantulus edwardii]|uniref:EP300-interacting inhibitor of differentiation 3 n=1 Tax=Elephantulus edwardii TaxID=28737 RepID=UPI0003F0EF7F|nr:PREDICTED: EP300-interacting inhibitor of differentiation 3 [Elephantulus edwardii]
MSDDEDMFAFSKDGEEDEKTILPALTITGREYPLSLALSPSSSEEPLMLEVTVDSDEDLGFGDTDINPILLVGEADEERCRHIRRQYRELMYTVQQHRDHIVNTASESLTQALRKADVLFDGVIRTREAALDAQFLVLASDLGKEKAKQLNSTMNSFNQAAFSKRLFKFAGLNWLEEEHDSLDSCEESVALSFWKKIQKEAACWTQRAQTFHFMLGSFASNSPMRKPRPRKRIRSMEANRDMPSHLKMMDLECNQETTEKEVERILGLLQSYFTKYPETPVSYFEFVIDPTSFARTVENMFHVSFIIRDGFARIGLDQDRLPTLEPPNTSHVDEGCDAISYNTKQGVISLSLEDWKNIVATFEISEPMIKHKRDFYV